MDSLWKGMKSNALRDTYQEEWNNFPDKNSTQTFDSSLSGNSPTKDKENNVNVSQSAPQPTCLEKIHYPIYDPSNPRHNPIFVRSRPTPFPNDPKTKTVRSSKSGGWTRMSPVRSLRKAKSGFLAFTEELRSKSSFCRGESTSKFFSPTTVADSPTKQNPKRWDDVNNQEMEAFSPMASSPDSAPTLKLDIQYSRMSLSPFPPSPSAYPEDEALSLDSTSVSHTFSTSSEQPAAAAFPESPYDGPSFLPLPEIHAPLEDPFVNVSNEPSGPPGATKSDHDPGSPIRAPLDTVRTGNPPETTNPDGSSYSSAAICRASNAGGSPSGDGSIGPNRDLSHPTESTERKSSNYPPADDSTIVTEDPHPRSSQSLGSQRKSNRSGDSLGPNLSAKDGPNPQHDHPDHPDNRELSPQDNQSFIITGTSTAEPCERLSETSTDEDSDFGIEIYRTHCLSERKPLPSIPNSTSKSSIAVSFTSLEAFSSNKLDKPQATLQSSSIETTSHATSIGQQSTKANQRSSEDSSSKSTIRWRDGYVKQERPDASARTPSKKTSSRNSRSISSETSATTVNTENTADRDRSIGLGSSLIGTHLHAIRTKDCGPPTPWGDLRHSVEAIERRSGFQLSDSSEALLSPIPQKSTRVDVKPIQCRTESEYSEDRVESSSFRNSTEEPEHSDIRDGETTSTSPVESLTNTVSHMGRSDGSVDYYEGLIHKEISGSNSPGSSQVGTGSGSTGASKQNTDSSSNHSYPTSDRSQSVDISAKTLDTRPKRGSMDKKGELSKDTCRGIISDGSIYSGPGLDHEDPASSAKMVLPEAIGPGSLNVGGTKALGSQSNFGYAWVGKNEDCEFRP